MHHMLHTDPRIIPGCAAGAESIQTDFGERLRPRTEQLTAELLDAATNKNAGFDQPIRSSIPATIIAEMLGVPIGDATNSTAGRERC